MFSEMVKCIFSQFLLKFKIKGIVSKPSYGITLIDLIDTNILYSVWKLQHSVKRSQAM